MCKHFLILCIFALITRGLHAQTLEKLLDQWAARSPIEKVYFHFDRNDYLAGQTIWFKGYLSADFLPATRSTSIIVELTNASSEMVTRLVLPVFLGFTRGQIELPDTLPAGKYVLRAYTPTMLNQDADFIYKKIFFITGRERSAAHTTAGRGMTRLEFFPEGGNMVTGLSNSIAFKATDENGLPVAVSGVIRKQDGQQVAELSSYHDGMGYFDLNAGEKTGYYAILNGDPAQHKYSLPEGTSNAVVLRVISSGRTKTYEILQREDNPVFTAAYMIGQMQHHVVFRKNFRDANDLSGIIPTGSLSSGVMQVTVFNKDGLPLAERLTFVDNREYVQPAEIIADTLDFGIKAANRFSLSFRDTVKGSFSISVYDASLEGQTARPENIYSGLLLTSDLRGYIHNPAYYFSTETDSVQTALDLVMMTNGWRRFRWSDLPQCAAADPAYRDPGFITIGGTITLQGTKKPFAGKELMMLVLTADSNRTVQMITTDAAGRFQTDSLVFFNKARIVFSDIKGKRSKFIEVAMDADSLHRTYLLPVLQSFGPLSIETVPADVSKRRLEDYDAIRRAEGLMLEGVTLTGKKKSEIELVEEKYISSGVFSSPSNETIDMVNKANETSGYQTIFDYLAFRVPGLQVMKDENKYSIFYRQAPSVSSLGPVPMALFLDEVLQADADAIAAIPPDQVALVKVYGSLAGAGGNAPGGALAIYLRKGSDYFSSLPSAADLVRYNGYSMIKEFYTPDYTVKANRNQQDHRVTLYWNAAVYADGVNLLVPIRFFNNDRTKQFRVVAEGMTADGKLLMIEKTFAGKKAF